MDQHTGLAATGSSRNHDAVGLLVGDDLHLSRGERPEELFVFLGRQVALDLVDALAAEVFRNEAPVVHLEVVLYELQRRVVVLDHQIGILAHDVDLLDLLLVEGVEQPVVVDLVARLVVLDPADVHRVVEDQKAPFELQRSDLREIEKCLLDLAQLQVVPPEEHRPVIGLELIQQLDDRELHGIVRDGMFLPGGVGLRERTRQLGGLAVEPTDGEAADLGPFVEPGLRRLQVGLSPKLQVVVRIFLFAEVSLDRKEIEQGADIFLLRGADSLLDGILVQLLARDAEPLLRDAVEQVAFELDKAFEQLLRLAFRIPCSEQVGRQILAVGQDPLLAHAFHGGDHLALAHPQNVGQVIDSRFGLRVLRLGDIFFRDERLDDADSLFGLLAVEQRRGCQPSPGFVEIPHGDACGVDVRNVVAPFEVAGLFKCCKCGSYPGLDVGARTVPTGLTRDLQCRRVDPHALARELLHSLPYLLNLADTQLRLVQQDEVLVQIAVAVEDVAAGMQMGVAAGASRLLYVVLQRIGDVVMNHQPHVALVHTHAEGRRGYDDAYMVVHEGLLVGDFLVRIHLAVEGKGPEAVVGEA